MKFNPGDKVTVISNPDMDKNYFMMGNHVPDSFTPEMKVYAGRRVTIAASSEDAPDEYKIEEDNGGWCWTDEMFVEGQPDKE